MNERAVTPVVGKLLAAGLVIVFVGVVLAGLQTGAVPGFRAAAADELGDRSLAASADAIEDTARADAAGVVELRPELPARIAGERYALRGAGDELVLEHPSPAVGGRVPLALPANATVTGEWPSDEPHAVSLENGTVELRTD